MDKNKVNVPKIRFPGFTDPWEQRRLSDIANLIDGDRGKNYPSSTDFYEDGHTIFLSATNITRNGFSFESNQYITEEKSNVLGNGKVEINDIVLTSRGSLGHIGWYNNDIKSLIPFARINSGMLIIRSMEAVEPSYIAQYMKSSLGKRQIELISFGSAQPQLTKKDMSNYKISITKKSEQDKIGFFFNNLDNLITLHQRKLNHLQDKKKGLLQKMFPKEGEKFPELRFPGFTDPWEQRKLGDIAKRITRKNTELKSTLPLTISAQYGLVDQITFFNKRVASRDVSGYYLLRKGEFAYNKSYSEGYPWGAIKRLERYENGVLSTLYICFKLSDVNSNFLVSYYNTNNWHKEIAQRAAEGARNHGLLNISAEDFFDTKLTIPKSKEEQARIGEYFKQLNNLITLHHRKLNHLQQQKKGLLQQMFI
ncbi:restriction endonuclease subunit S [Clostridium botulinum]|uniref:Sau1hsdS1 n=1 Tax=Clostridium botulinum (strain Eklund 17B / Type B) TaxID=935198 RepID=B2TLI5_CLOBB|nr:Sau1hsdS1 [Clostridium botulinum B str. Eklund 17B (NRP)]MBY6976969.1 restriction endonuclease subunit S [Clostridium botulinum]MBY6999126.1 restriction endonuclease subunit S [Clostridium botulinum]MCR1272792.1 restriction endonuclease subunit S [Clostridium botulinum]NFD69840.1 restriction endonuclease subunit S [Clostridium botulinum]